MVYVVSPTVLDERQRDILKELAETLESPQEGKGFSGGAKRTFGSHR